MKLKSVMTVAVAAAIASPLLAQQPSGTPGGFGAMDRNGDGYISRDEARDAPWSNRFSEFDKDNDSRLSLGEYDAMRQSAAAGAGADKDPRSPGITGGMQGGSSASGAGGKPAEK
jgi:hypothetical protein